MTKQQSALQKAIDICGSQAALARAIGVAPMTVTQWKQRGIPAERCVDVEKAVAAKVTRQELRPDLFKASPNSDAA